jgi:hypothetical protein
MGGAASPAPASLPAIAPAARVAPLSAQARHRGRGRLFIADEAGNVLLYPADIHESPKLLGEITDGVTRSVGVATDRNGTLYVVNSGGSSPSIAEYKRGAKSPFKTITSGLRTPGFDAVDASGYLYVADVATSGGIVQIYAPGAGSPSKTIEIPTQENTGVGGLAFDPGGALLVNTFDVRTATATVYRVPRGSSSPQNLNLEGLPGGLSLGADETGNIYAGGHAGDIAVYSPGSKSPSRTISLGPDGFYTQMLVTPDGTIYWPDFDDDEMFEIAPGASAPTIFATPGSGVDAAVGS